MKRDGRSLVKLAQDAGFMNVHSSDAEKTYLPIAFISGQEILYFRGRDGSRESCKSTVYVLGISSDPYDHDACKLWEVDVEKILQNNINKSTDVSPNNSINLDRLPPIFSGDFAIMFLEDPHFS